MSGNDEQFDANLKRMLASAVEQPRSAFQDRLVRDVLAEVSRQGELERAAIARTGARSEKGAEGRLSAWVRELFEGAGVGLWSRRLAVAGTTVAVLLTAAGIWWAAGVAGRTVGQVKCVYGVVAVQDNGAEQTLAGVADLRSGQKIETRAGSKAEIVLLDQSRLVPDPRTTLHIAGSRQGPRIFLEQGTIELEAAKQRPGKAIRIDASRAQIKVLGTRLEVRLVEKPSGARQTRVRVLSGQVEMQSAGKSVVLWPGTEGVADADQPPSRCSVVFEVNELTALFEQTRALSVESGRAHGLPAIIDLTTDTLWSVVPAQRLQATGPNVFKLKLKYPAFRAAAFTLEGAEVPVTGTGETLRLDLSAMPGRQVPEYLILKVPGVGGLLTETEEGINECSLPGTDTDLPSLVEFHLPESARLEQVRPGAIGTRHERNRTIVTVDAKVRVPEVCE